MVEMAIVLPLFLLMIMGGLEYALQFHVRQVMTNSARNAARQLAVQNGTVASAKALAISELTGINANFTVTATDAPSTTNRDVVVYISVPRSDISLGLLGTDGVIDVEVTMRKEGS